MSAIIHGDASGNQLNASANKTQVYGLKGNDTLTSDGKSDVLLIGGSGNDSLIMNGGNGTLSGGAGSDVFELNYSANKNLSAVIEDLEPSSDKIIVNFDGSNAPQLSSMAGGGSDVVWRDADGNFSLTLKGIRENDYFDGDASEQAWQVLKFTNDAREENNLSWLTMADGLTAGAQIRVQEITALGQSGVLIDHTRPGGLSWATVLEGKYHSYGENLDGGATSAEKVVQDWMNSQAHKENILDMKVDKSGNPIKYKKLGVGYNYFDEDISDNRYYWVQLFADSLNGAETVSTNELSAVNLNVNAVSKFIELDDEPNTLDNAINGATIAALGGDDAIRNSGMNVSISGGNDSDTLINGGGFGTINGGRGNDLISLNASAQGNLIQYTSGDGSDTVDGFNSDDTLAITGREEYTPVTIGNDVVVSVGNDSILLTGAASLNNPNIDGRRSKLYILTDKPDTLNNTVDGATINALGGDDTLTNSGANVLFNYAAGDGSDIINGFNTTSTLSITGDEFTPITIGNDVVVAVGNDSITLTGAASLNNPNINGTRSKLYVGTRYSDTIETGIDGATIRALAGNDRINLTRGARNVLIEYAAGDNDNFVSGFSASDTLSIAGVEYKRATVGNDLVLSVGDDSITLQGAATLETVNIIGTEIQDTSGGDTPTTPANPKLITLTEGNDRYNNRVEGATIAALGGNDEIGNGEFNSYICSNVSISGGEGDDSIANYEGFWATIDGGMGNDLIRSWGNFNIFNGGDGNDLISNRGDSVTIDGGEGDDSIHTNGKNVSIHGGEGHDSISNSNGTISNKGDSITIDGGAGDDSIWGDAGTISINGGTGSDSILMQQTGLHSTTDGGEGNDSISHNSSSSTVNGGKGDDSIKNTGWRVMINGDEGDDIIWNKTNSVTINGGNGNDSINLSGGNQIILYTAGDGNDTIVGFSENDTLSIFDTYSSETIGNDIIFTVGTGSIVLSNAATLTTVNIGIVDIDNDDNLIILTEGNDTYNNTVGSVTITALGGNDLLDNEFIAVSISGGTGNDSISNDGQEVTISGDAGNDSIGNGGRDNIINGDAGNDEIFNYAVRNTINAGAGNDSIYNSSSSISIDAGVGDDYIETFLSNAFSINGGTGNDFISLSSDAWGNLIQYTAGDGNDTISGIKSTDIISIAGGVYTSSTVDNNVIFKVGDGSITLLNALIVSPNIFGIEASKLITLTEGDDTYSNTVEGATIAALGGNDSLDNNAANVSIDGGSGNDSIMNYGDNVIIDGGTGNDSIDNWGDRVTINGGDGNDYINSDSDSVTIDGGAGRDVVSNVGDDVIILGGAGNDTIYNYGDDIISADRVTIDGGEGDDSIRSEGNYSSISGGLGNDSIFSSSYGATINGGIGNDLIEIRGASSSVDGGAGNDSISNYADYVTINGGAGDDTILNYNSSYAIVNAGDGNDFITDGSSNGFGNNSLNGGAGNDSIENGREDVTILGGAGDDRITLKSSAINNVIRHAASDGNDTVWGYSGNTTLNVLGVSTFSSVVRGDDVIIRVGNGSVHLVDARNKPIHIIIGESGSSGGTGGNDGGNGNGGNDGGGNGGSGGNSGGNSSGGGSGNEGRGSDASGGNSASGSRGNTGNISGGGYGSNKRNPFVLLKERQNNPTPTISAAPRQIIYTGGNQVVGNYTNEKIIFGTTYTGSFVDGGNFYFGSETGALALENATNKFIDVRDASDNPFIKAYTASTAGVIDGRNLSGFEVLNGSAGSDEIFAGNDGSQMWGGSGNVTDNLTGGNGVDIFIGGQNQGADNFRNASSADIVHFNDASLRDIAYTSEDSGTIAVNFRNGNVVNVQSTDNLSAKFLLADGAEYRYDHEDKSWQSQIVYSGGNMTVPNYTNEKIIFATEYAGAFVDGNNFNLLSTTGALTIQNAADKIIDLRDGNGNEFIKGYVASSAGVIDGRGLAGFEVFNGSTGSDEIFAGNNGSQMWGGAGNVTDVLTGGNGVDIFIGGQTQGADNFRNASSNDIVHLNDASLSDIVSAIEDNGTIAITFANGNVVNVQSTDNLSARFLLADGSTHQFNHATKSW